MQLSPRVHYSSFLDFYPPSHACNCLLLTFVAVIEFVSNYKTPRAFMHNKWSKRCLRQNWIHYWTPTRKMVITFSLYPTPSRKWDNARVGFFSRCVYLVTNYMLQSDRVGFDSVFTCIFWDFLLGMPCNNLGGCCVNICILEKCVCIAYIYRYNDCICVYFRFFIQHISTLYTTWSLKLLLQIQPILGDL